AAAHRRGEAVARGRIGGGARTEHGDTDLAAAGVASQIDDARGTCLDAVAQPERPELSRIGLVQRHPGLLSTSPAAPDTSASVPRGARFLTAQPGSIAGA